MTTNAASWVFIHPDDRDLAMECFARCIVLGKQSPDPVRQEAARELETCELRVINDVEPGMSLVQGRLAQLMTGSESADVSCWAVLRRRPSGWFGGTDGTVHHGEGLH